MADISSGPSEPKPSTATATVSVASAQDTQTVTTNMAESVSRASIMARRMKGRPLTGAAIFSTEDGRTPARDPPGPPYPPTIVKSNPIIGVVLYANEWRNAYPQYYHRFFPDKPWAITDLWDKAEIHLQEPDFLSEVLGFITRDNMFRANQYADGWWRRYPEKFELLGGDLQGFWDPNEPLSIVDRFFTNGEQNEYPTEFLWHALHFLRSYKIGTLEERFWTPTEAPCNASVQEQKNEIPDTSNDSLRFTHAPPPMALLNSGAAVVLPSTGQPDPPAGPPFEGHGPTAPSNGNGPLLNPKNRFNRIDSGSFAGIHNHPQQNGNLRAPSGGHIRQSSGPVMHGQAPRNPPNIPTGPGYMNTMNQMPHFQQATQLSSPPMHPSQMAYPPMMPHGPMPPPLPLGFVPHSIDPAFPPHGINMFGPRGMPFGDMTNAMPYSPDFGMDNRGMMDRRDSSGRHPSDRLYNPYRSERPDKAANFKKSHRNSSGANSQNRARKYSVGSRHGSNAFDRDEGMWPGGGRYTERVPYGSPVDAIVNDMERGCDARRIGAKNKTVQKLYISNLPEKVTESELLAVFKEKADAIRVELRSGIAGDNFTHAFVIFSSPTQARKCLSMQHQIKIQGKTLNMSVPHQYWKALETTPGFLRGSQPAGPSAHGRRRSSTYDRADSGAGLGKPFDGPQYSPQDARSDLARKGRYQREEYPAAYGSPEDRKSKMHTESQFGRQQLEENVEMSAKILEVVSEQRNVIEPTEDLVAAGSQNPEAKEKALSIEQDLATIVTDTPSQEPPSQELPSQESSSQEPPSEEPPLQKAIRTPNLSPPPVIVMPAAEVAKVVPEPFTPTLLEQVIAASSTEEPTADFDTPISPNSLAHAPSGAVIVDSDKVKDAPADDKQAEEDEVMPAAKTPKGFRPQDEAENDLSFHSAKEAQDESTAVAIADSQQPDIASAQVPDAGTKLSSCNTVQSTTESGKKSGVQQTQSLFPFAKPSKAQKQKEKQAKKKDKKKEKTKVDKTSLSPVKPGYSFASVKDEASQSKKLEERIEAPTHESSVVPTALGDDLKFDEQPQQKSDACSTAPHFAVSDQAVVPMPKLENPSPSAPVSKVKVGEEEAPKNKPHHLTQIAVPKFGQTLKTPSSTQVSGSSTTCPLGTTGPTRVSRTSEKSPHDQSK